MVIPPPPPSQADVERHRQIAEGRQCGLEVAAEAFGIDDPTDIG